jgi:DNA-binding response OmpR family regulator
MHLLIAEDDVTTAGSLVRGFSAEGFTVRWAKTAEDALASLLAQPADVAVLDWMLPDGSGLEVIRKLRARGQKTPVLLLTARDAVADRVDGLEAGADDYLTKPFAFAELLARLRALLRRAQPIEPLRRHLGDLTVDFETRRASRGGSPMALTPREFDLLAYLVRRAGEVVSRDQIAREVWNESQRATPIDNVIDVHVARLRRKLDDGRTRKLLHTVRGVGLMMKEEPPK